MSDSNNLSGKLKLSQLMDGEWHQLNPSECVASLCADEELRGSWMRYHLIRDAIRSEPVKADELLVSRICDAIKDEPVYSNIRPFNAPGMQHSAHASTEQLSSGQADESSVTMPDISESGVVERSTSSADRPAAHQSVISADSSEALASDTASQDSNSEASWFKTGLAGFGLAASVALATVVGLNLFQQQPLEAPSTVASNDTTGAADIMATPLSQAETFAALDDSIETNIVDNPGIQNDSVNLPVVEFVSNTGAFWESPSSATRVVDEDRLNMLLSLHIENSPTTIREGLLPYSRLVGYQENTAER